MKIYNIIICMLLFVSSTLSLFAQENVNNKLIQTNSNKAWEIGVGISVFQFNRVSFSNFINSDNGYQFDLDLKHALYGINLYVSKELNKHLYIDVQGTTGYTKQSLSNKNKNKWMYKVGAGLQWRLGEYFGSKYIDPYLRSSINYMYKDFGILYKGNEGIAPDEMEWVLENIHNKDGMDRKKLMPLSLGGGINMWLNDRVGIGLSTDYLFMPYKNVANSLEGTIRLIYRIGGNSKKPAIHREYIEKFKEIKVEVPIITEKVIESPAKIVYENLCDIFNNITFEFDKDDLTLESEKVLDQIAVVLKQNNSKKYLISGYTDSKGSAQYNIELSQRRAAKVVNALIDRGVDKSMLISRGLGNKISLANSSSADNVRNGDRKVTIEAITNLDYWEYLSNNE